MKIDLNSPVEVWRIDAPNTGFPSCELTLFNLSGQQVVSVEVTLTLLDPDGQEITRITHRAHGLTGAPMRTFSMTVPVEEPANVGGCEAIIEKVWYDNSSIWRRGKEPLTEYTPNNLHRSTALSELREVAGNMAAGYPEMQGDLWLCVCGRPNPVSVATCARCGRDKRDVFTHFSKEAVDAVIAAREKATDDQNRVAVEETSKLQAQREQEVTKRRRHRRVVAGAVALIVLILGGGYGIMFHLLPQMKYNDAQTALTNGEYTAAAEKFAEISSYKDAADMEEESNYRHAEALLDSDNVTAEDIAQARTLLDTLTDQTRTDDLRKSADYQEGLLLLNEGKLDDAEKLFTALGDYENSRTQLQEIAYRRLSAEMETASDYDAIREGLTALAGEVVPGLDRVRAVAGLLLAVDEVLELARGEFLVVYVQGLQQTLDRGELVARVEDLEQLRQPGIAMMGAQQAVGQAVEGADPHPAGAHRQHGGQPGEHLLGSFVGKCNRQNAGRIDLTGLDQPGDAGGQHAGLARAGTGEDQRMLPRKGDGLELFGVEIGEQRGHRGSFSNPDCIGSAAHDRSRALKRQCCTATTSYLQGSVNQLDCSCALHNKSPESGTLSRPAGSELCRIKENKRARKLYCATTLTMDWPSMKQPADEGAVPRPEWRTHHENAETAALVCPQGGRLSRARRNPLAQSRTRSDPGNGLGRQRRVLGLGNGPLHPPSQGRALHPVRAARGALRACAEPHVAPAAAGHGRRLRRDARALEPSPGQHAPRRLTGLRGAGRSQRVLRQPPRYSA